MATAPVRREIEFVYFYHSISSIHGVLRLPKCKQEKRITSSRSFSTFVFRRKFATPVYRSLCKTSSHGCTAGGKITSISDRYVTTVCQSQQKLHTSRHFLFGLSVSGYDGVWPAASTGPFAGYLMLCFSVGQLARVTNLNSFYGCGSLLKATVFMFRHSAVLDIETLLTLVVWRTQFVSLRMISVHVKNKCIQIVVKQTSCHSVFSLLRWMVSFQRGYICRHDFLFILAPMSTLLLDNFSQYPVIYFFCV